MSSFMLLKGKEKQGPGANSSSACRLPIWTHPHHFHVESPQVIKPNSNKALHLPASTGQIPPGTTQVHKEQSPKSGKRHIYPLAMRNQDNRSRAKGLSRENVVESKKGRLDPNMCSAHISEPETPLTNAGWQVQLRELLGFEKSFWSRIRKWELNSSATFFTESKASSKLTTKLGKVRNNVKKGNQGSPHQQNPILLTFPNLQISLEKQKHFLA